MENTTTPDGDVVVALIGGPLDGEKGLARTPVDWQAATLRDLTTGDPLTDEPYIMRFVQGTPEDEGAWFAVSAMMLQDAIRDRIASNTDTPKFATAATARVTMMDMCASGEHDFGPWETTRGGNRIRHCRRCPLAKASVL